MMDVSGRAGSSGEGIDLPKCYAKALEMIRRRGLWPLWPLWSTLYASIGVLLLACGPAENPSSPHSQETGSTNVSLANEDGITSSFSSPSRSASTPSDGSVTEPLMIRPSNQVNQLKKPVTFKLMSLETDVVDESFTPHFHARGKVQVVPTDDLAFEKTGVIHLWLSYKLVLEDVQVNQEGTLTLTLHTSKNSGLPEGAFELKVPLPRHDLSAEQARLTFDVLGWQPLNRGRLLVQPVR